MKYYILVGIVCGFSLSTGLSQDPKVLKLYEYPSAIRPSVVPNRPPTEIVSLGYGQQQQLFKIEQQPRISTGFQSQSEGDLRLKNLQNNQHVTQRRSDSLATDRDQRRRDLRASRQDGNAYTNTPSDVRFSFLSSPQKNPQLNLNSFFDNVFIGDLSKGGRSPPFQRIGQDNGYQRNPQQGLQFFTLSSGEDGGSRLLNRNQNAFQRISNGPRTQEAQSQSIPDEIKRLFNNFNQIPQNVVYDDKVFSSAQNPIQGHPKAQQAGGVSFLQYETPGTVFKNTNAIPNGFVSSNEKQLQQNIGPTSFQHIEPSNSHVANYESKPSSISREGPATAVNKMKYEPTKQLVPQTKETFKNQTSESFFTPLTATSLIRKNTADVHKSEESCQICCQMGELNPCKTCCDATYLLNPKTLKTVLG